MELIKIKEHKGQQAVSARELYYKLGYEKSQYSRWYKRHILENTFAIEGEDYEGFVIDVEGNQVRDFALSLDFAKKLCMLSKTKAGERIRDYFIQCEKKLKNPVQHISRLDLAKMIIEAEEENQKLQIQLKEQESKVVFTNAVIGSASSCLIGELAKVITQNGCTIGQNKLFEWLRNNGYLGTNGERYNIPNQKYIEQGLFELKKGIRTGKDGVLHSTITPKVTGKGQVYFVNKFLNKNYSSENQ